MMQSVDKNKVEKLSIWCNQEHSLTIVLWDKPDTKAICIADFDNAYIVSTLSEVRGRWTAVSRLADTTAADCPVHSFYPFLVSLQEVPKQSTGLQFHAIWDVPVQGRP